MEKWLPEEWQWSKLQWEWCWASGSSPLSCSHQVKQPSHMQQPLAGHRSSLSPDLWTLWEPACACSRSRWGKMCLWYTCTHKTTCVGIFWHNDYVLIPLKNWQHNTKSHPWTYISRWKGVWGGWSLCSTPRLSCRWQRCRGTQRWWFQIHWQKPSWRVGLCWQNSGPCWRWCISGSIYHRKQSCRTETQKINLWLYVFMCFVV